jgi:hypothetical protein
VLRAAGAAGRCPREYVRVSERGRVERCCGQLEQRVFARPLIYRTSPRGEAELSGVDCEARVSQCIDA